MTKPVKPGGLNEVSIRPSHAASTRAAQRSIQLAIWSTPRLRTASKFATVALATEVVHGELVFGCSQAHRNYLADDIPDLRRRFAATNFDHQRLTRWQFHTLKIEDYFDPTPAREAELGLKKTPLVPKRAIVPTSRTRALGRVAAVAQTRAFQHVCDSHRDQS